ncbi:MAG: hypothetical protein ACNA8W_06625 [Bradymonadaceae bacterium]
MRKLWMIVGMLLVMGCSDTVTDGDGEWDLCEGTPHCPAGYDQLPDGSDCESGQCEEVTECGVTIVCEAPSYCEAAPVCPEGARELASSSECTPHASCESVTVCNLTIWCSEPVSCDGPPPICPAGATAVASESDCPQDDVSCYSVHDSLCGQTVWCWEETLVEPSCDIDGCPEGQYCYYEDRQCGASGVPGVCRTMGACTDDISEVCGCDGISRVGSSTCVSQHDGVDSAPRSHCEGPVCPDPADDDVVYYGENVQECAAIDFLCPEGQERFENECGCGCIVTGEACDIDGCPDGQYCHYEDGVCGDTGLAGVCKLAPQSLTEDCFEDELATCGCDGKFYSGGSHCYARTEAGVDGNSDGEACS